MFKTTYLTAEETPYPTRYGHIVFTREYRQSKLSGFKKEVRDKMTQINLVEGVDFKFKTSNEWNIVVTLQSDEAYVWAKMLQ